MIYRRLIVFDQCYEVSCHDKKGLGSIRGYFGLNILEKIECVCLLCFILTLFKRYHVLLEMTSELLIVHVPLLR